MHYKESTSRHNYQCILYINSKMIIYPYHRLTKR